MKTFFRRLLMGLSMLVAGSPALAWSTYAITSLQVGDPNEPYKSSWAVGVNQNGAVLIGQIQVGGEPATFIYYPDGHYAQAGFFPVLSVYAINDAAQIAGSENKSVPKALMGDRLIGYGRGRCGSCGATMYSVATTLNDHAEAAGVAEFKGAAGQQAFKYQRATGIVSLGTLGGSSSEAIRINQRGDVVGNAFLAGDHDAHAFLYAEGVMQDLGTLGGHTSWAQDLNANGHVVGCSLTADNVTSVPFLYAEGTLQVLPSLGGTDSCATALDNAGNMVGYSTTSVSGDYRAVIMRRHRLADLNSLLDTATGAGWTLRSAVGINAKGQIVGSGVHNGLARAFLLTPLAPP